MDGQEDVWGRPLQPRLNQATLVQNRASKDSVVPARQAPGRHSSFSANPQLSCGMVGAVTKTTVTKVESDDDEGEWSEVSELQEIDPRQLQSYKDQNSNVDKRNFGKGKFFFKPYIEAAVCNVFPIVFE